MEQDVPGTAILRKHIWSRDGLIRLLVLLIVILVIVVAVFFRSQFADFHNYRKYGYFGVFVVNLIGSASFVLPVPSLAAVVAGGILLNPVLVGLFAGVGQTIGELTGYMLGYSGQGVLEKRNAYARLHDWMQRRGSLTLFVLAVIPNPLFDLAGAAAGALRFPVWKFLLAVWAGKTIKSLVFAFGGALGVPFVIHLFS